MVMVMMHGGQSDGHDDDDDDDGDDGDGAQWW